MSKRLLIASVIALLFTNFSEAQVGRPQKPPSRGSTNQEPATYTPVMLIGSVVYDDGTDPEEPILVEMVCFGEVRRQTFSSRGKFSFSFGMNRPLGNMDASSQNQGMDDAEFYQPNRFDAPSRAVSGKIANSLDLSGCELRAVATGFTSARVLLSRRRSLDGPNVGDIVLHPAADAGASTVSVTTLQAPKKAKKSFERAQKELRKHKANYSVAVRELEKAVVEYPEFAAAWNLLGRVHVARQDTPAARASFQKSVAADSEFTSPFLSLARLEAQQGRWEEAAKWSDALIELDAENTEARYFNAVANYSLGKLEAAEESALKVNEADVSERYPVTSFILGGIEARKGDISAAAANLERYLELQPEGALADQSRQLLAQWTSEGLIGENKAPDLP